MKFNIVINLVLKAGINHSTATDAYAFKINGLPIPLNVYPIKTYIYLIIALVLRLSN